MQTPTGLCLFLSNISQVTPWPNSLLVLDKLFAFEHFLLGAQLPPAKFLLVQESRNLFCWKGGCHMQSEWPVGIQPADLSHGSALHCRPTLIASCSSRTARSASHALRGTLAQILRLLEGQASSFSTASPGASHSSPSLVLWSPRLLRQACVQIAEKGGPTVAVRFSDTIF